MRVTPVQGYFAHKKQPPLGDPAVVLCLGTYGGPRGVGACYERGTPRVQAQGLGSLVLSQVSMERLGRVW